jgi:hypothetical protein
MILTRGNLLANLGKYYQTNYLCNLDALPNAAMILLNLKTLLRIRTIFILTKVLEELDTILAHNS